MKLSRNDIDFLTRCGLEAALAAAQFISSKSNQAHTTELKSGTAELASQIVTAIDLESQRLILEQLTESIQKFDLGLLTEESPDDGSRFTKEYFWCIDPLDGTLPFTERRAGYAVSIALIDRKGQPIIGIVVDPFHMETYQAVKGQGFLINGMPLKFHSEQKEDLVCHFDRSFVQSTVYASTIKALESMSHSLGYKDLQIRTGAGAVMNALGLLDVEAGCYFKFPKPYPGGGCLWDFAATSLIYEELGLHVSDIYGKSLTLNKKGSPYMNESGIIYATDRELSQQIVDLHRSILDQ